MPNSYKVTHPKFIKHYLFVGNSKNTIRKTKFQFCKAKNNFIFPVSVYF